MSSFKDYIAADNKNVFLNEQEFAEKHNLNGSECVAVVQEVVINDDLTTETQPLPNIQMLCMAAAVSSMSGNPICRIFRKRGIRSGWTENTVKWHSAKTMKVY